jgi:hypothetical protein
MRAILLSCVLLSGCQVSPLQPSPAIVPPALLAALDKLDETRADSWSIYPSSRDWVRSIDVKEIRLAPLENAYGMAHPDGSITIDSRFAAAHEVNEIAAVLAHELRHIEGYSHTCGPNRDMLGTRGAWFVHLSILRQLGEIKMAHEYEIQFPLCPGGRMP